MIGDIASAPVIGEAVGTIGYDIESGKKVYEHELRGIQPRDHGRPAPVPDGLLEPPRLPAREAQEGLAEEGRREEAKEEGQEAAARRKAEGLAPHGDPGRAHVLLRLGDRVGAVVEDRGDEHGVGAALEDARRQVLELARAA